MAQGLGWFYLLAAGANLVAAWWSWRGNRSFTILCCVLTALMSAFAASCWLRSPPEFPEGIKGLIDRSFSPVTVTLGSFVALAIFYWGRNFFVQPPVAWLGANFGWLALGLGLPDAEFARIVLAPDNIAIVGMLFAFGFFLWLGLWQAVENDRRRSCGQGPREAEFADTVLVWPDLVYIELIAMLILATGLIVWALAVPAPLEAPANPSLTPNPAKAPWYFVGLQEMLVYFDASVAGVIIPCLIIFGLMAIPYLDPNPRGSGYYTVGERPWAIGLFLFGFLQLWILLIVIGTFFRGPNWQFRGPFQTVDPHAVGAIREIRLSEYFWVHWLGSSLPQVELGRAGWSRFGRILWRELPGVLCLTAYFGGLPWILSRTALRGLRQQLGRGRFLLFTLLLLMMLALPIKMLLRWLFQLSYVVAMPEYFFNF